MLGGSGRSDLGCRAFHNAAQSIPNATVTVSALNSERYDNGALHDTVTNNSRITVPVAGRYLFTAASAWANNVTGQRVLALRLNGVTVIAQARELPAGGDMDQSISAIYDMAVNDYIEMTVFQDSGGPLNLNSTAAYSPELSAQKINLGG